MGCVCCVLTLRWHSTNRIFLRAILALFAFPCGRGALSPVRLACFSQRWVHAGTGLLLDEESQKHQPTYGMNTPVGLLRTPLNGTLVPPRCCTRPGRTRRKKRRCGGSRTRAKAMMGCEAWYFPGSFGLIRFGLHAMMYHDPQVDRSCARQLVRLCWCHVLGGCRFRNPRALMFWTRKIVHVRSSFSRVVFARRRRRVYWGWRRLKK